MNTTHENPAPKTQAAGTRPAEKSKYHAKKGKGFSLLNFFKKQQKAVPQDETPAAAAPAPAPAMPGVSQHQENLEKIRRKRRRRRLRLLCVAALCALGFVAYLTGIIGTSIAVLADVVDSIVIVATPGDGWPQSLTLTNFDEAAPLSRGFVAVGSSDMVVYSPTGKELVRAQHSYANPSLAAGSTRVCLYNRGSTGLQIFSRMRSLYTYTADAAIRLCTMADNGTLAVLTNDSLVLLDSTHTEILRWKPDADVSQMAFSSNSKQLAVACLTPQGGQLGTSLYVLDVEGKQEYPTQVGTKADGIPVSMRFLSAGRLLVVYDNGVEIYNTGNGTTVASYAFGMRQLAGVAAQGRSTVLLFGSEKNADSMSFVVLNSTLEETAGATIGEYVSDIEVLNSRIYCLTGSAVAVYDTDGGYYGTQPVAGDAKVLLNTGKILVVTTEDVQRFTLEKEYTVSDSE